MRGAARLLHHLNEEEGKAIPMKDFLVPSNFDEVAHAALKCATIQADDEEDLLHPSAAIKVGFDVTRLANIKLGIAVRENDAPNKQDSTDFLTLMKMEWTNKVSKIAHKLLRTRRMHKPVKNPIPADLQALALFLKDKIEGMPLKLDETTAVEYRDIGMYVLARILLYNKRRAGELEQMLLASYESRSTEMDESDTAMMGDLTKIEQALLGSQEIVKIQGKADYIVPVLIPPDCSNALAFLTNRTMRKKAGVKDSNPYVFGNTGMGTFRAYDALKRVCCEAEVDCPERKTSVTLRKYFATMTQVIGMKDHELQWICKHLGHSVDVHKLHYRATSGYIERINLGKLILIQDFNAISKFKDKSIEEISVDEIIQEGEDFSGTSWNSEL